MEKFFLSLAYTVTLFWCFIKPGFRLFFGSVVFSSLILAFVKHALRLFFGSIYLKGFFSKLQIDLRGFLLRNRNWCFKEAERHRASECLEILSLRHSTEISLSCEGKFVVFVWLLCVSHVCWITPCTLWSSVKEHIDQSDCAAQEESPESRHPAESNL